MKKIKVSWTIKYPHVVYGNPYSPIAVCIIYPHRYPDRGVDFTDFDAKQYKEYISLCERFVSYGAAVAGLQNTELGVFYVAKTILSNPNIRYLVVVGKEFGHKIGSLYRSISLNLYDESIRRYLSRETFDSLRSQIEIIDLIGYDPFKIENIVKKIIEASYQESPKEIVFNGRKWIVWDKGAVEKYISSRKSYRLSILGYTIIIDVDSINSAWIVTLDMVSTYGVEIRDWRGRRLVLPYTLIINIDNPLNTEGLDKASLDEYFNEMLSGEIREGESYTYGHRLFKWFGLNQVEKAINKIRNGYLTQGHITLYDPRIDLESNDIPCITEIHIKVIENEVSLRASIRSWDVARALPFNLYALSRLLELIAKELKKSIGKLIIIADEPHIYL